VQLFCVAGALASTTSRRSLVADVAGMNISYTGTPDLNILLVGAAAPNRNALVTEEQ